MPALKGWATGQLTVTASVTPDANAACDASTVMTAQRQAQFNVTMSRLQDANDFHLQLTGHNEETVTRVFGSADQYVTLTLNMSQTLTSPGGAVLHEESTHGTVQIQESRSDGRGLRGRLIDGTLSVRGDTVVFAAVRTGDPLDCLWPNAGRLQRTGSDGVAHTLVFSSACGSATLDGATVTLPRHAGNGPQGAPRVHQEPPPLTP